MDKTDPMGPAPERPELDPQYIFWETALSKWLSRNGLILNLNTPPTALPNSYDDVHSPEFSPQVFIISPNTGIKIQKSSQTTISYGITKQSFPIDEAEYYIGETFLGKSKYPLTTFVFTPDEEMFGEQTLSIKVYDTKRNQSQASVNVEITP